MWIPHEVPRGLQRGEWNWVQQGLLKRAETVLDRVSGFVRDAPFLLPFLASFLEFFSSQGLVEGPQSNSSAKIESGRRPSFWGHPSVPRVREWIYEGKVDHGAEGWRWR